MDDVADLVAHLERVGDEKMLRFLARILGISDAEIDEYLATREKRDKAKWN